MSVEKPGITKIDKGWFMDLMAEKAISQKRLAEHLDRHPSQITLLLNGERAMKIDEAAALSRLLGVDVEELLVHAGAMDAKEAAANARRKSERTEAKVVGWIDDAGVVHKKGVAGPEFVSRPPGASPNCVALRAQNDGPMDGWVVYYTPASGVSSEAQGSVCVVDTADGRTMIRRVKRGYGGDDYSLSVFAGFVPPSGGSEREKLKAASVVSWFRQMCGVPEPPREQGWRQKFQSSGGGFSSFG